jgi:hypothetical protein
MTPSKTDPTSRPLGPDTLASAAQSYRFTSPDLAAASIAGTSFSLGSDCLSGVPVEGLFVPDWGTLSTADQVPWDLAGYSQDQMAEGVLRPAGPRD